MVCQNFMEEEYVWNFERLGDLMFVRCLEDQ
jgi:hypothetical protein